MGTREEWIRGGCMKISDEGGRVFGGLGIIIIVRTLIR